MHLEDEIYKSIKIRKALKAMKNPPIPNHPNPLEIADNQSGRDS